MFRVAFWHKLVRCVRFYRPFSALHRLECSFRQLPLKRFLPVDQPSHKPATVSIGTRKNVLNRPRRNRLRVACWVLRSRTHDRKLGRTRRNTEVWSALEQISRPFGHDLIRPSNAKQADLMEAQEDIPLSKLIQNIRVEQNNEAIIEMAQLVSYSWPRSASSSRATRRLRSRRSL